MNYKIIDKEAFENLKIDKSTQLIDVREAYEFEDVNIGGLNIPMAEVLQNLDKINCHKTVVICCQSGNRSKAIAYHLSKMCPNLTIYSLDGGIKEYLDLA